MVCGGQLKRCAQSRYIGTREKDHVWLQENRLHHGLRRSLGGRALDEPDDSPAKGPAGCRHGIILQERDRRRRTDDDDELTGRWLLGQWGGDSDERRVLECSVDNLRRCRGVVGRGHAGGARAGSAAGTATAVTAARGDSKTASHCQRQQGDTRLVHWIPSFLGYGA